MIRIKHLCYRKKYIGIILLYFSVFLLCADETKKKALETFRGEDADGWTHLTYVKPITSSVGYSHLKRYKAGDKRSLNIGDKLFDIGMFAHATSSIKYRLNGKCSEFKTFYGIVRGAGGAAIFTILADGKEVFRSREMYGKNWTHDFGIKHPITLDISGVKILELKTLAVRGGAGSWSAWGDPKVK